MTDYIDRAAAITSPLWAEDLCPAAVLNRLPAADVAPVVHGRWEGWTTPAFYGLDDFGEPIYRDATFYRCSICSRKSAIKEKFCPSCGAMMDLEESR